MGSLFGTDGIRGRANQYPVTPEIAMRLGRAVVQAFRDGTPPKVVVGKDTRLSGYMLESALASGITSMGGEVVLLGPVPTPAVAFLTHSLRASAGLVISASHNSFEDNGLKIFQGNGFKCEDALEEKIEKLMFAELDEKTFATDDLIGKAYRLDHAIERYGEMAKASFPAHLDLKGMNIAVDCANGAAYKTTPMVLRDLGAEVTVIHDAPNGVNINYLCGSTHPEAIQGLVRQTGAEVGFSHDGDADRLICCDEKGEIVDGDEILAILALHLLERKALKKNTLVATVMSNFGLEEALASAGGKVLRVGVGDRYVIEAMLKHDLNLGGEQSGHLIFCDHTTTGDGLISALQVLRVMRETKQPLSMLRQCLKKYPQLLINEKVREKKPLEELPAVQSAMQAVEQELSGVGRVLLRYSGTESKVRLLLEGRDEAQLRTLAEKIMTPVRAAIGLS
jgi:phosphoglucosamine mutase